MDAGEITLAITGSTALAAALGAGIGAWSARRKTSAEASKITVEAEKVEVETSSEAVRLQAAVLKDVYAQLERQSETLVSLRDELAAEQGRNADLRRQLDDHIRTNWTLRTRIAQLEDYLAKQGLGPLPSPGLAGADGA